MKLEPLQRLLRLREQAVEQARLVLADAIAREVAAENAVIRAREAVQRDGATGWDAADGWFGGVAESGRSRLRHHVSAAMQRLAEAQQHTSACRARVAIARGEAEAIETLIAERCAEMLKRREEQAAHGLDDVVRARLIRDAAAVSSGNRDDLSASTDWSC